MPLDPAARALLDAIASSGAPELCDLPLELAREASRATHALQLPPEPVASVEDRVIDAGSPAADRIPVRIYRSSTDGRLPVLVYFHGGGHTIGDLDTQDSACRALANGAGCAVVSVDYRLAPEHPFPAPLEDAYAATRWVAQAAEGERFDATRVAVGGDSAGGNLAAAVALAARDRGGPPLVFQLLVYPTVDGLCESPSHERNGAGYLLTSRLIAWFRDNHVPRVEDRSHPLVSPLRAESLACLPPALVISAEFDPLVDEGRAYAARLRDAGVAVRERHFEGMIHGFWGMGAMLPPAAVAIREAGQALASAFRVRG